ncbi:flagellar biosynthetic protein FliO [Rhizobium sp. LCM 4573]|uniref:flagellar biosynthetic protein FliO n=1 Tax=Rhizobium sp. LCM 4573 TaxID=1848291 RepID=UPI0008D9F0DB|nr:flagellar biosynthetic protein FliO [Rhizobium sp. LCM 4573]OHV81130.1 hypothetical protein LCM4573_22415 [Rhizobium sp. LCM 4573]
MVEELMGAYGSRFVIAILGVAVGLLCLIAVLWLLRGRSGPSPFVRGGKNRQPRLQVLDAAAVDTRRRLVLVRRDDVEHLIMIGGPTDIVIESRIAPAGPPRTMPAQIAPVPAEAPVAAKSRPVPEPRTAAAEPHLTATPEQRLAAAGPTSMVAARAVTPEPEATPARPRQEPVLQAPDETPHQISRPAPGVNQAEDMLEAARGRVFGGATEPVRAAPVQAVQPDAGKVLGSDFERILEEEMASNLAARQAAASGDNRAPPPRNPAVPPVTGATPEPTLQAEVARIFGEMSVTRDK